MALETMRQALSSVINPIYFTYIGKLKEGITGEPGHPAPPAIIENTIKYEGRLNEILFKSEFNEWRENFARTNGQKYDLEMFATSRGEEKVKVNPDTNFKDKKARKNWMWTNHIKLYLTWEEAKKGGNFRFDDPNFTELCSEFMTGQLRAELPLAKDVRTMMNKTAKESAAKAKILAATFVAESPVGQLKAYFDQEHPQIAEAYVAQQKQIAAEKAAKAIQKKSTVLIGN
jgi:hypothetical protein